MVAISLLDETIELEISRRDPAFFITQHCQIYDAIEKDWIVFDLWQEQKDALTRIQSKQLVVWLKSRQIGATWLGGVAYPLWSALFQPIANILLFSLREQEAVHILDRLKGMYKRLPDYMQVPIITNQATLLEFANGSAIRAFPTGRGDSYTATYAFIDEADLIPDLDRMLGSIKPTIDAGGKLVLASRANKRKPNTAFKQIYQAAQLGDNGYTPIFMPWYVHPARDNAWYEQQKKEAITLDDLYEQYPATDSEALALGYQGRIYNMFSLEEHVSKEAEYTPNLEVLWGVDLGYTNPNCFLMAQQHGEVIHVFAEYYQNEQLIGEALESAIYYDKTNTGLYPNPDYVYYDPEDPRFPIELQNLMLTRNKNVFVQAGNNRVADGIKTVQRFLKTKRLLIHPRCKNLIREILEYHYAESGALLSGGDVKPALGQDDHAMSAIRYLLTPWFYEV